MVYWEHDGPRMSMVTRYPVERGLGAVFFALVVPLFVASMAAWQGSSVSYLVYSVVFLVALVFGARHYLDVGYLLLVVILWTGYWLKMSLHLLDPASTWIEPIGQFDFSPVAWDEVALVASVGGFAVLIAGFLWRMLFIRRWTGVVAVPARYTNRFRFMAWSSVACLTSAVVLLNEGLGIFHAGLRPAMDLSWPLQGLWGWLVSIGIALMVMVLFHWEVLSGRSLWLATALFVLAVAALSVTSNSRGAYVLQVIPVMAVLVVYRRRIAWLSSRRLFSILFIFILGALVTIGLSQHRRSVTLPQYYEGYNLQQDFPSLLKRLAIDRWVGLEGIMAVSAYPDKKTELLTQASVERRDLNHIDLYTKEISSSGEFDTTRYHYATLPGSFAFLYYSGSLVIVFIGTLLMTWCILGSEYVINATSENPFLSAQIGMYATTLMIQLGAGGLVQPASVLIFSIVFALALSKFSRLLLGPKGI